MILLDKRHRPGLRGGRRPGHRRGASGTRRSPEGVQPPIMLDEFLECEEAVRQVAESSARR